MTSQQEDLLVCVPTEVWSLVAHYMSVTDIIHQIGSLSTEIHNLFHRENNEFWKYILLRDGYEYERDRSPFVQYTELASRVLSMLPFRKEVNNDAPVKEVHKILLYCTYMPSLTMHLMEWLDVRIPHFY
jgi:hypothetical protein